jgi:hypothetical protein
MLPLLTWVADSPGLVRPQVTGRHRRLRTGERPRSFNARSRRPILPSQSRGNRECRANSYPPPPYSEATYYVYERDGNVICTKVGGL